MRKHLATLTASALLAGAVALGAVSAPAEAADRKSKVYSVADLLKPCIEGDNDSRWGEAAEAECEQYINGFTDAITEVGYATKENNICLPALNRADEIRWAFMRWAHQNYDDRGMPASEGLLATLKATMTCN